MSILFRKEALKHLSSPDQLYQAIQITNRRSWIAILSICALMASFLSWSIFGSIPTRISGPCIFLKNGGIFQVVSQGAGQIVSMISISPGDHIMKGQEIASVTQPVLSAEYEFEKNYLEELKREEKRIREESERALNLNYLHHDKKSSEILIAKKAKGLLVESLGSILVLQEELLRDGIITRQTYEATRQSLFQAKEDIQSLEAEARQITYEMQVAENDAKQKKMDALHNIQVAQAKLENTSAKLMLQSKVISPFSGQVVEVKAYLGDTITEMATILDVLDDTQDTNVVMYIPPFGEAKNVKKGMTVEVSPDAYKREEYGFIYGHVSEVSMFPATREGMIALLHAPRLVDTLSNNGPSVAINVDLVNDPKTKSKFEWSSVSGETVEVTAGSTCIAKVKLKDRPPITLVMPWLKKAFGII